MSQSDKPIYNWPKNNTEQNLYNTPIPDWLRENQEAIAFTKYKVWLKSKIALPPFPNSSKEENPYSLLSDNESYDLYTQELEEYSHHPSNSDKSDYVNDNIGYKFHLNVSLKHIREVSSYLKKNGYSHKFLKRGDVSDGKVFTIYIGS